MDRMPGHAGQCVSEPGRRVDMVELCRLDQRRHGGGTLGAAAGACKQPRFSTEGKTSERSLGGIVRQASPLVLEE